MWGFFCSWGKNKNFGYDEIKKIINLVFLEFSPNILMKSKKINKIFNIDARDIEATIDSNLKITSTITSPPYFDMKDYESDNQIGYGQSYEDYLNDLQKIFKSIFDITNEDGSLWIIIDTFKRNNQVITLPFDLSSKLKETGWLLQDIIIWKKDKTVPWSKKGFVQRKFEYILFFSKSENFKYNKDKVRNFDTSKLKKWWVKYPERYNPKGKAIDEIWEFPIPVQGSWGDQYIRHFCPLPKEMVATMIEISSDVDDIILDPFSGSGSVLFQSAIMERNYLGFELNKEYIKMFKNYFEDNFEKSKNDLSKLGNHKEQEQFEKRILDLRALKYGRLLINILEKKFDYNFKIFVRKITEIQTSHKLLEIDYDLLGDFGNNQKEILANLIEIIEKPPFSKFGINPNFKFSSKKDFSTKEYFGYTKTNSYSFSRLPITSDKIKIISDICMDLDEKEYN